MADDRVCEGYHVIKSKRIKDVEIVLAHNPKAPSPYVTWKSYAHRQFTAVKGLTAGSSFVNVADVGGVYNGAWVQAVTRWVTTVYGKPTPLPRTGY